MAVSTLIAFSNANIRHLLLTKLTISINFIILFVLLPLFWLGSGHICHCRFFCLTYNYCWCCKCYVKGSKDVWTVPRSWFTDSDHTAVCLAGRARRSICWRVLQRGSIIFLFVTVKLLYNTMCSGGWVSSPYYLLQCCIVLVSMEWVCEDICSQKVCIIEITGEIVRGWEDTKNGISRLKF